MWQHNVLKTKVCSDAKIDAGQSTEYLKQVKEKRENRKEGKEEEEEAGKREEMLGRGRGQEEEHSINCFYSSKVDNHKTILG